MNGCDLPAYDRSKCTFFALGRNAMYAACLGLGLGPDDEILTPAFDCDGALQPFRVLGCRRVFYRSDPHTFNVDIDDMRRRVTSRTKVVHVINHFGFPQRWERLEIFRRETGIPILEDNAYSLFSECSGKPLGSFGDLAIFSLRKNLPLLDGGMLRVNNPALRPKIVCQKARWCHPVEYRDLLRVAARSFGLGRARHFLKGIVKRFDDSLEAPPPLYSDYEKGWPEVVTRDTIGSDFSCDYIRPMSGLARSQLNSFKKDDIAEIARNKRSHYQWLVSRISPLKSVRIIWPQMPDGAVPFCLSIILDKGRDTILDELRKTYDVMAWPTLPGEVLGQMKDFPEVEYLGRKMLQINLPSDKVRLKGFSKSMENLAQHICAIT